MARGKLWKPTKAQREDIEFLALNGVPHDRIARIYQVTKKTLIKHCKKELEYASDVKNAKVARCLYYNATVKKKEASIMFWLKCRAGWRENDYSGIAEEPPTIIYQELPPGVKPPEEETDETMH